MPIKTRAGDGRVYPGSSRAAISASSFATTPPVRQAGSRDESGRTREPVGARGTKLRHGGGKVVRDPKSWRAPPRPRPRPRPRSDHARRLATQDRIRGYARRAGRSLRRQTARCGRRARLRTSCTGRLAGHDTPSVLLHTRPYARSTRRLDPFSKFTTCCARESTSRLDGL